MITENSDIESDFAVLSQLNGFLDLEAFRLFFHLAKFREPEIPILEIGVYCGRSLAGLACAFDDVPLVGVDPFYAEFHDSPAFEDEANFLIQASGNLSPGERKKEFWRVVNVLEKKHVTAFRSRIRLKEVTQDEFFKSELGKLKYQLCHVDGEHTFSAVKDCLDVLDELLVRRAWLIIDDLFNPGFPDISEAVHTHKGHRKTFWPVFFGFNKGVYLYRPEPDDFLAAVKAHLAKCYSSAPYAVRLMHDNSIEVNVEVPSVGNPANRIRRSLFSRIKCKIRSVLQG